MTGVALTVKSRFESKEAIEALQEVGRRAENKRPLFMEIGEYLLESTEQRFSKQLDPDGDPWKPLSPRYRKRKKKNAGLILVLEQHLASTLAYQASDERLELGSNRIYAATMQLGDDDRNIPARPYLGVSTVDEREITAILQDFLQL